MLHVDMVGVGRLLGWAFVAWMISEALLGDYDLRARWLLGSSESAPVPAETPARFEPVVMPAGVPADAVWIFAHRNCPSADRRRAEALVAGLQRVGIPHVYVDQVSFTGLDPRSDPNPEWLQTRRLMESGDYPVVMLDGVGKANPKLDEVITEYRRFR